MPYDEWALERHGIGTPEDYRSPFAHDRDRILYSSAFRRLAGKTQVVASTELGLYHNRLTHTLKVAQLGRRLAERLREKAIAEGIVEANDFLAPRIPTWLKQLVSRMILGIHPSDMLENEH